MDIQKEREAFEAAVCERYGYTDGSIASRRIGEHYSDASLSQAWAMWQARAALSAEAGPVAWRLWNGKTWRFCYSDAHGKRGWEPLMTVAQHQRIVAQRDAKLAGVVEALRAISAYAPCSGVKDPGFTKMHMGILARNALAAAGVEV